MKVTNVRLMNVLAVAILLGVSASTEVLAGKTIKIQSLSSFDRTFKTQNVADFSAARDAHHKAKDAKDEMNTAGNRVNRWLDRYGDVKSPAFLAGPLTDYIVKLKSFYFKSKADFKSQKTLLEKENQTLAEYREKLIRHIQTELGKTPNFKETSKLLDDLKAAAKSGRRKPNSDDIKGFTARLEASNERRKNWGKVPHLDGIMLTLDKDIKYDGPAQTRFLSKAIDRIDTRITSNAVRSQELSDNINGINDVMYKVATQTGVVKDQLAMAFNECSLGNYACNTTQSTNPYE
jgi:hypothetical protein